MMADQSPKRRIEYLPPAREDIFACAQEVCDRMAAQHGDTFADPDIVHGLAEFMRIAARIHAKHLNRVTQVDTNSD